MIFRAVVLMLFNLWAFALGGVVNDLDETFKQALLVDRAFALKGVGNDLGEISKYSVPLDPSVVEDAKLSMVDLVSKYGYPVEKHTVQTEDGYLLSLYRIPNGRNCTQSDKPKTPVLLQHGLLASSFDFVIMGPKISLAYLLADRCYDVWLGNNRGNGESKAHVVLNPKEKKFWDFSWHEMGIYDLPALIDYILDATNQPSLHYIGHSQGTTQFFVMGSLRPEYQKKIRSMHCLSPVAFMGKLSSPLVRVLSLFSDFIKSVADKLNIYEIFPSQTLLNILGIEMCRNQYPELQFICSNVMFLLCGFDEKQMNKTMLPAIIGHTPAGAGVGPIIHYDQGIHSGYFRQYDYGEKQNMKIYKSKTPPSYPVEKIKIPIALYYGRNDFLAALPDVEKLSKRLPNVIESYMVPFPFFNHLDFIFAVDLKNLLHKKVLKVLEKY